MPDPLVEIRTQSGQPVTVNGATITPHSQAVILRLPRMIWGFIWNRPTAVAVQTGSEPEKIIPIWDVTRLVQFGLLGLGLLGSFVIRRLVDDRR